MKEVLRAVVDPQMVNWDVVLEDLQFTLNNPVHEMRGYTTHFLLCGYQTRIPVELKGLMRRLVQNFRVLIALLKQCHCINMN